MSKYSRLSLLAAAALITALPAQAITTVFFASMSGAAESPPVNSPGTGFATVTFNDTNFTVNVVETWANLLGNATVNHIHVATTPGGTGGVVLGFPIPNPSPATGSFTGQFTLTQSAFNSLLSSTAAGLAYVNLHSSVFGGGEIRGFLAPVPEPGAWALMLGGLAAVGALARRRS